MQSSLQLFLLFSDYEWTHDRVNGSKLAAERCWIVTVRESSLNRNAVKEIEHYQRSLKESV